MFKLRRSSMPVSAELAFWYAKVVLPSFGVQMACDKSGMKLADEAKATPTPNMRIAEVPRPQP